MSVTLNGTSGLVFSDGTIQGTAAGMPFRNRVINGDMRIDQRNSGAAVTPASNTWTLDRYVHYANAASKITYQQVADAPAGFLYSLKVSVASQYTPATGEVITFGQNIEGTNMQDLNWGTASASTVTLSFWIKSSVAGQVIPVSLQNNANSLNYVTTVTISAANTWQYVTKTIPGPTSGAWETGINRGVYIGFGLGGGSNAYTGTVTDQWQSITVNNKFMTSATGQFVQQATGSSFNITGLQLEKAAAATTFETRPIQTETAMCERYYQGDIIVAVGGGQTPSVTNRSFYQGTNWRTTFRTTPTLTLATTVTNSNMGSAAWTSVSPTRGRFSAVNTITNDCFFEAIYSGNAEI